MCEFKGVDYAVKATQIGDYGGLAHKLESKDYVDDYLVSVGVKFHMVMSQFMRVLVVYEGLSQQFWRAWGQV